MSSDPCLPSACHRASAPGADADFAEYLFELKHLTRAIIFEQDYRDVTVRL
jgi:hypothetical protein